MAVELTLKFYTEGTPGPYSKAGSAFDTPSHKFWGGSQVTGGNALFFHNEFSSEPTTARVLNITEPDGAEGTRSVQYLDTDPTPHDVLIEDYVTDSGYPNSDETLTGLWIFDLEAELVRDNPLTLASADIYCKVYKRSQGGSNTLLFTTYSVAVSESKVFRQIIETSAGTLATTDRLFIEVWAHFANEA